MSSTRALTKPVASAKRQRGIAMAPPCPSSVGKAARPPPLHAKAAPTVKGLAAKAGQVPPRPGSAAPREAEKPTVWPSFESMMSEAALTVKSKLQDASLDRDLRKWIVGAALGKPVLVVDDVAIERVRRKPAVGHARARQHRAEARAECS